MKIILVGGARPNFIKIAPIQEKFKKYGNFESILVHTGQHYDYEMSKIFFEELNIPTPDFFLNVGSASHARQTAMIMMKFEDVLLREKPDLVMVVGDVNSTLACALTAAKMQVKVAHVEAGLRSRNWSMPEEINRVLTDRLSDFLFTPSRDANENLKREGMDEKKIFFVGNVMVDTLLKYKKVAEKREILKKLCLNEKEYAVLTLHRPENVDSEIKLSRLLDAIKEVQECIKIISPLHPRTQDRLKNFDLIHKVKNMKNLEIVQPLGYLDFLELMLDSKFVLTDSGGVQEETTVLGIPCLTLRNESERPITVTQGTNVVVGTNKEKIVEESKRILKNLSFKKKALPKKYLNRGRIPELWDGKAAERIVDVLRRENEKFDN